MLKIYTLVIMLFLTTTALPQQLTATQMLGQQAGALLTQNAELIEMVNKLKVELEAVTQERDKLKAEKTPEPKE